MAACLNQSANEVVQSSKGTTLDLARATSKFGNDFSNFLEAGVDMAGTSPVSRRMIRTSDPEHTHMEMLSSNDTNMFLIVLV